MVKSISYSNSYNNFQGVPHVPREVGSQAKADGQAAAAVDGAYPAHHAGVSGHVDALRAAGC